MDKQILALLKDKDSTHRRQGIMLAGRSGDSVYIKPLVNLSYAESDPALRDLADKAIKHLRSRPAHVPAPKPASEEAPPRAPKAPETKSRYSVGGLLALVIFAVGAAAVAGAVVWVTNGERLQNYAAQQRLAASYQNVLPLPVDQTAPAQLEGKVYFNAAAPRMNYYVQEPVGTMPPDGWSLVVALHGWGGDAMSMIQPLSQRALEAGVLFVVPEFDHSRDDFPYEEVYSALYVMLGDVNRYYKINQRATVLTGFSWGGRITEFYTATYPQDFAGAVVGGSREYIMPPSDSPVRYAVFIGENDFLDNINRPARAREFVSAMEAQGTPVWFFEITPNIGHAMAQSQVDKIFELVDLLEAGTV